MKKLVIKIQKNAHDCENGWGNQIVRYEVKQLRYDPIRLNMAKNDFGEIPLDHPVLKDLEREYISCEHCCAIIQVVILRAYIFDETTNIDDFFPDKKVSSGNWRQNDIGSGLHVGPEYFRGKGINPRFDPFGPFPDINGDPDNDHLQPPR